MPRFSKWLSGITPTDPADQVARDVLEMRLRAVLHYLDRAVAGPKRKKSTHQLRVWTRRAAAALKLFADALPNSKRRWVKKQLRKIRRRAGAVRDCDVHLERLKESDASTLLDVVRTQRRACRKRLKSLCRKLQKGKRFTRRSEKMLNQMHWRDRQPSDAAPLFGSWCRDKLKQPADKFFALANAEPHANHELHALRIAGKNFRYALELAACTIPASAFQVLYDELTTLQKQIGAICDQVAGIDRWNSSLAVTGKSSVRRALEGMLRRERSALEEVRREYFAAWPANRFRSLERAAQAAFQESSDGSASPPVQRASFPRVLR